MLWLDKDRLKQDYTVESESASVLVVHTEDPEDSYRSDHKAYYTGAQQMTLPVTGDIGSGKLLGAQIAGHWRSEVAKRIDVFATALFHGMRVDELNDLDLSYTPPLSNPWDPVQLAAQNWVSQG